MQNSATHPMQAVSDAQAFRALFWVVLFRCKNTKAQSSFKSLFLKGDSCMERHRHHSCTERLRHHFH
eukprot:1158129-Pelagomonas_calceolata.AAC.11